LRVPLPRDFGWVHHASLARSCRSAASASSYSWKVVQLGAVLRGSGGRSWAPLSSGSQDGSPCLRLEVGGPLRCDWKEGAAVGRRSWPVFQCRRKIPRSGVGEGCGLTSAPLNPPRRRRLPLPPPRALGAAGAGRRFARCYKKSCDVLWPCPPACQVAAVALAPFCCSLYGSKWI